MNVGVKDHYEGKSSTVEIVTVYHYEGKSFIVEIVTEKANI